MQETFTSRAYGVMPASRKIILAFCFFLFSITSFAQVFCANETVIFSEDFGNGSVATSSPEVVNLTFAPSSYPASWLNDNFYRVINNTRQRGEWHDAPNHTPTGIDGKMLVINGNAETFFVKTITNGPNGFPAGFYGASLFLMNVNKPGTCAPNPLLPTITLSVEYNTDASSTTGWVALQSVTAAAVPQTPNPTWVQLGGAFTLPVQAQRMRLTLSDGTVSGCGNDFAVDDIKFATCPDGGPLPVEFINITATQKGAGVSVNWSTASESNNKYFDIEKSTDGVNWTTLSSLNGAGNSSTLKSYAAYDAKPVSGFNYYRIKQVDIDQRSKYSSIAKVKIEVVKTGISVLTNPFLNAITVDFLSNSNQFVNVKLSDVSGKVVSTQKWKVTKGTSRLMLSNVANIQRGMYIFTVVDEDGTIIYNNKLIKQ